MPNGSHRQPGRHRADRGSNPKQVARHRGQRAHRAPSVSWRPQLVLASSLTVAATALLVGAGEAQPSGNEADLAGGNEMTGTSERSADERAASMPPRSSAAAVSRGGSGLRAQAEAALPRATAARTARATQAKKSDLPPWLAVCDANTDPAEYANGQLPEESLCALPLDDHQLEASAARAWWELDRAYQEQFGAPLCVTDTYRSLDEQYALRAAKPGLTAEPGTSTHGLGTAMDLCGGVESFYSAEHQWLRENGGEWGWELPDWAQEGGSLPEPWHWEYVGE